MVAKIGLHAHADNATTRAALAYPWPIVKELDGTGLLEALKGTPTILVLRDSRTDAAGSTDAANYLLSHPIKTFDPLLFWTQVTTETARGYDPVWQREVIQTLRNGGYQGGILICVWPTGNPTAYDTTTHADGTPHFPDVMPLLPLLQLPGVGMGLDAYTAILSSDQRWANELVWMPCRHRLIYHCCEQHGVSPRVIICESGGDDGEPAHSKTGSWTGRGWSAADYVATLAAIDKEDQQDAYLLGRCVFTLGADSAPQWQPYEIAPIIPQLAAYVQSQQGAQMPSTAIPGFDVSSYQGQIDWLRAANAGKFAGIKVSEGVYPNGVPLVDQYGAQNMAQAKASGLLRLPYHFGHPDLGNDPVAEADAFLATANLQPGDVPVLDIEVAAPNLPMWANLWLDHVASKTGAKPILYTYLSYVQQYFQGSTALAQYPLWLADYTSVTPAAPLPWASLPLWQYGSSGTVPGIVGKVDVDVALVALADIAAFGVPQPATPSTGGTDVPTGANTTAAAKARWEALGVGANPATAIFAAYASRCAAWIASGQQPVLDPTPCVHPEAALPSGDAYAAFDNGEVYHWKPSDGKVYLAEIAERPTIFKACGWGTA